MRWLLLVACACSAPAQPAAIESRVDHRASVPRANDCPYLGDFTPWTREVFPACAPVSFDLSLAICVGSNCGDEPCEIEMRSPDATTTTMNVFDGRGRFVARMKDLISTMACDYDGERRSRCSVNGIEHWVTRDANGRITALVNNRTSRPLTYDASGRLVALGEHRFAYDERGWLRDEFGEAIEHDAAGHVLAIGSMRYAYDGDRLVEAASPQTRLRLYYDHESRLARTEDTKNKVEWRLRYECK